MTTKTTKTTTTTTKTTKHPADRAVTEGTTIMRYAPKETVANRKQTIKVLVKENPKRAGTKCWTWFTWYRTGMTVEQYYEKGGRPDHVRWDVQHGYIALE